METPTARALRNGSALRLARCIGSWNGRAPHALERLWLADDARTAVLESFSSRWVADLETGEVREDPREPEGLGVRVQALRSERRRAPARGARLPLAVRVFDEGPAREGAPRYVTARVGPRERARHELLEAATGRPLLRLARRWPSGYSSCGAFFVYFVERGRRAVVFEPSTGARREVALALDAAVTGAPQLGAGARDAVLELRPQRWAPRALVGVSLEDGVERWRRAIADDERLVGRCDDASEPDGAVVWTARACEELRAYRVDDGAPARTLRDVGRVSLASFARDGAHAVVSHANLFARVSLRDGGVLAHADTPEGPVEALAWEPGGDRFAAGFGDGRVQVRDRATGALVHDLEPSDPRGTRFTALAFEPGSSRLWCLGEARRGRGVVLEALDAATGLSEAVYELGAGSARHLACAPDGSCLWLALDGADERASEGAAVLWSCRERRILRSRRYLRAHEVPALAFARDEVRGEVLAELYLLGACVRERFSVRTGEQLGGEALRLAFDEAFDPQLALLSPDGARLYALDPPELAIFERRGAPRPAQRVRAEFEFDAYTRRALAPGNELLAYLDNEDGLWLRGIDGRLLAQLALPSSQDRFVELALAPDERTLLAGTEAGVVFVFDVRVDGAGTPR